MSKSNNELTPLDSTSRIVKLEVLLHTVNPEVRAKLEASWQAFIELTLNLDADIQADEFNDAYARGITEADNIQATVDFLKK